jgi:hypothetical protein
MQFVQNHHRLLFRFQLSDDVRQRVLVLADSMGVLYIAGQAPIANLSSPDSERMFGESYCVLLSALGC